MQTNLLGQDTNGSAAKVNVERGSQSVLIGVVSALCVVGLFSGFVLVSKAGLRSTLAPLDLLAIRFSVAGILMFPIFMRHKLLGLSVGQAFTLAFTGGLGFAAFAYGGFGMAPASHGSALIHGTLPLTTLLISIVVFRERGVGFRVAGALVVALGILLLVADSLTDIHGVQIIGDGLLLGASFCWSSYGILARRHSLSAIPAAALVAVLSAGLFVPAYCFFGKSGLPLAGVHEVIWQALFQGIAIGIFSLIAYTRAVAILGAANTALFAAAAPALTTLLSIPLLHESPSAMTWLGVACVTLGIVGTSLVARREASIKAV